LIESAINGLHIPAFRPRPPWWGGDLQTLRNFLIVELFGVADQDLRPRRLLLPMADGSGDHLVGAFTEGREDLPVVVLIHGLTGCADSSYIVFSARHFAGLGYPVLRLSLRGAGPSREVSRDYYHAGRSDDLRDALGAFAAINAAPAGMIPVGYSLGGNMLCRFLARHGHEMNVRAAAIISAPIDLKATSDRFLAPRNRLYHRWLLRRMKEDVLGGALSGAEKQAVEKARTVYAFDDDFIAPRFGFETAERYYAECAGQRFLPDIRVPTLIIHARNDPWIPAEPYRAFPWSSNRYLMPVLAPGGGHVGFHQAGDGVAWHDRAVEAFLRQQLG